MPPVVRPSVSAIAVGAGAFVGRISADPRPVTYFGPDFPFPYDDWIAHPAGLGRLPPERHGTEVAIVGAGAAGVIAAYELMRLGLKPVLYEAGRLGGTRSDGIDRSRDGTRERFGRILGRLAGRNDGKLEPSDHGRVDVRPEHPVDAIPAPFLDLDRDPVDFGSREFGSGGDADQDAVGLRARAALPVVPDDRVRDHRRGQVAPLACPRDVDAVQRSHGIEGDRRGARLRRR